MWNLQRDEQSELHASLSKRLTETTITTSKELAFHTGTDEAHAEEKNNIFSPATITRGSSYRFVSNIGVTRTARLVENEIRRRLSAAAARARR